MGNNLINIPKRYTKKTNCPNCGAVITGDKCEYCGTVFNNKNYQNLSQIESQLKYAIIRLEQEAQTEFIKTQCLLKHNLLI